MITENCRHCRTSYTAERGTECPTCHAKSKFSPLAICNLGSEEKGDLEIFFRRAKAQGIIDFAIRIAAERPDGLLGFYIHPQHVGGITADFIVVHRELMPTVDGEAVWELLPSRAAAGSPRDEAGANEAVMAVGIAVYRIEELHAKWKSGTMTDEENAEWGQTDRWLENERVRIRRAFNEVRE